MIAIVGDDISWECLEEWEAAQWARTLVFFFGGRSTGSQRSDIKDYDTLCDEASLSASRATV